MIVNTFLWNAHHRSFHRGSQWIFKYKCFRMHLHTTFVFVYFHLCIFICVFVSMYIFCVFVFCIFICVFVFDILWFIFWQKVHIWLSVETAVRKSRSICDSIVIDPLHWYCHNTIAKTVLPLYFFHNSFATIALPQYFSPQYYCHNTFYTILLPQLLLHKYIV